MKKICRLCQKKLPLTSFYLRDSKKQEWLCKSCTYFRKVKKKYNITEVEYIELYNKQNNVCAICKISYDKMCIDHDHTTLKVRGILCTKCNFGIGQLNDNIERLENAITYLKGDINEN
jgi:hypothetical protein